MRHFFLLIALFILLVESKKKDKSNKKLVAYTDIIDADGLALAIENRYVIEPNTQYPRNDLQNIIGSVEKCMEECDRQQGCVGFERRKGILALNHCQLKSHLVGQTKNSHHNTYKLTIFSIPQLSGEVFAVEHNSDYPKSDIVFHNVPFVECPDLCILEPYCIAYVLDMLDFQGCWLKSELMNQAVVLNGHRITYKKIIVNRVQAQSTIIATRSYVADPGFSYVGNIIKRIRGNDCMVECDKMPGCIAVTIDQLGICYLKNKALNRTASFVHMSYVLLS